MKTKMVIWVILNCMENNFNNYCYNNCVSTFNSYNWVNGNNTIAIQYHPALYLGWFISGCLPRATYWTQFLMVGKSSIPKLLKYGSSVVSVGS